MARLVTRANALFAAGLAVLFVLIGLLYVRYDGEVQSAQASVEHTYQVLAHIKDLMLAVDDVETGQRGYLLTGRDGDLAPYTAALDRATSLFGDLQQLTADNPIQQTRLRQLSPLLQQRFEVAAQSIELRRSGQPDAALALVNTDRGSAAMRGIRQLVADMTGTEEGLLAERASTASALRRTTIAIVACGALAAVLFFLLAAYSLRGARRERHAAELRSREALEQLRVTFDSLSQGVAVFDAERRLANWNECFVGLMSVPANLAQRGTPYAEFVTLFAKGGDFLETEAQIRADERRPDGRGATVYRRSAADGRSFELRRTPISTGGFAITLTDISAQIEAEKTQRETQKMRALGELTGGVAHDFNNLLTVVVGNLEILRAKLAADDNELGRYVAAGLRAAQRGATLTGQLLAFGRRQPLAPRSIDLNLLVSEMASGMLRRTLGEQLQVRFVEAAGLWPAFADPAQVENAVLNLALNARDAMAGGGTLTIETANVTLDERYAQANEEVAAGQYVMLAVSDTGSGMPPEVVARAFEPFFTTKPEGKGTGLGLAMVHGFAKQSKGHVKIYSEAGHGTTVKLYLPRAQRAPADEQQQAPVRLPTGTASILVVEDDADVRRVVVAHLGELGYRVFDAGDAESALKVFGETPAIDLLLTDVVLPGRLRGKDLAALIQRASPTTRILFMSGYTENAIVHEGRLDDGVLLLSKPFRREDLAIKVAVALSVDAAAIAAPSLRGNGVDDRGG